MSAEKQTLTTNRHTVRDSQRVLTEVEKMIIILYNKLSEDDQLKVQEILFTPNYS